MEPKISSITSACIPHNKVSSVVLHFGISNTGETGYNQNRNISVVESEELFDTCRYKGKSQFVGIKRCGLKLHAGKVKSSRKGRKEL